MDEGVLPPDDVALRPPVRHVGVAALRDENVPESHCVLAVAPGVEAELVEPFQVEAERALGAVDLDALIVLPPRAEPGGLKTADGPSAEALQDGRVEGINTPAGVPTGAVTKLFAAAAKDISPLEVTDEQLGLADGGLGLWTRFVIPAGTYPGQEEDWNTMAQPNFLAVRDDVSEEFVYLLTKTIYENLPFLQAIHKATNAMSLERALAGLPVPLHPGAARYYREVGIEVPAALIAE